MSGVSYLTPSSFLYVLTTVFPATTSPGNRRANGGFEPPGDDIQEQPEGASQTNGNRGHARGLEAAPADGDHCGGGVVVDAAAANGASNRPGDARLPPVRPSVEPGASHDDVDNRGAAQKVGYPAAEGRRREWEQSTDSPSSRGWGGGGGGGAGAGVGEETERSVLSESVGSPGGRVAPGLKLTLDGRDEGRSGGRQHSLGSGSLASVISDSPPEVGGCVSTGFYFRLVLWCCCSIRLVGIFRFAVLTVALVATQPLGRLS